MTHAVSQRETADGISDAAPQGGRIANPVFSSLLSKIPLKPARASAAIATAAKTLVARTTAGAG